MIKGIDIAALTPQEAEIDSADNTGIDINVQLGISTINRHNVH